MPQYLKILTENIVADSLCLWWYILKWDKCHNVFTLFQADKLVGNSIVSLLFVAIAHALVVAVMVSAGHISGGHINPAVTLGLAVGGHITVFKSILYVIDQLLASAVACILLKYVTGGLVSWKPSDWWRVNRWAFSPFNWLARARYGFCLTHCGTRKPTCL